MSAKATEETGACIAEMQNATQDSVNSIEGIVKVIEEMSRISTTIAAAVEEQSAATQEIARNVQQASSLSDEVGQFIASVRAL